MRKISEVLEKSNTAVWFYIGIEQEIRACFSEELKASGYTFLNGDPISEAAMGRIVSVHTDNKIANVSLFAWTNSFHNEGSKGEYYSKFYNTPKVDYKKYISGADDYLMTSCNYKKIY